MTDFLILIAHIVNEIHDLIISYVPKIVKANVTDKVLHFWVIGVIGIFIFFVTDVIFKRLVRWSVSIITFIYTVTVLVIFVFGLEIQQKLTGRGNMELQDIVYGLWGFIFIFSVYLCIKVALYLIGRFVLRNNRSKN